MIGPAMGRPDHGLEVRLPNPRTVAKGRRRKGMEVTNPLGKSPRRTTRRGRPLPNGRPPRSPNPTTVDVAGHRFQVTQSFTTCKGCNMEKWTRC